MKEIKDLKVLIVDDEHIGHGIQNTLYALIKHHEVDAKNVMVVTRTAEAMEAIMLNDPPDLLVTRIQRPDIDGNEIARAMTHENPATSVYYITGWDRPTAISKIKAPNPNLICEPAQIENIRTILEEVAANAE